MASIEKAGFKPGDDVVLALDCASTEFFKDGKYVMAGEGTTLTPAQMTDYLADLVSTYPIKSIEDGLAEDDFEGWQLLTDRLGSSEERRVGNEWDLTVRCRWSTYEEK